MKPTALVLVILMFFSPVFSQDRGGVKLTLLPVKMKGDSLVVIIQVNNATASSLFFYKPRVKLVDFHILNFIAYGKKQKDSVYYNRDESQLDQIVTSMKNCDLLKPGEGKEYLFSLDRKLFRGKRSDKGFRKMAVEIIYSNGEIVCNDCNIPLFYGRLMAENVVVYE